MSPATKTIKSLLKLPTAARQYLHAHEHDNHEHGRDRTLSEFGLVVCALLLVLLNELTVGRHVLVLHLLGLCLDPADVFLLVAWLCMIRH